MDISGFGMMIVSCCFMAAVPIPVAYVLACAIHITNLQRGKGWTSITNVGVFLLLSVVTIILACLFLYFFYLRYMYVM